MQVKMKTMISKVLFVFMTGLIPLYSVSQNIKLVYVSVSGNDKNPGTEERPFLSFQRACSEVAQTIAKGAKNEEFQVFFKEGVYHFAETVVIDSDNFATGTNKITFSSWQNEKVVFSAAIKISEWSKAVDKISHLPDKAKGKVWTANIPAQRGSNIARFLCNSSGPLPNAVSEALYSTEDDTIRRDKNKFLPDEELSFFSIPKPAFRNWENIQDIEIITIPKYGWTMNILPLKTVDMDKGIAYTVIPATYRICRLANYDKPNLWVQNAVDYLDKPGEWTIDSSKGKIYYWPAEDHPGDLFYPNLQEIIRVVGDEKNGKIIQNIEFRGITFTHGDRDSYKKGDTGLQHDWAFYNKSDALLRFVDTKECVVENCEFKNSGGGGVRFDFYSQDNKVQNCRFYELGGTGILLAGYGPGRKNVNRNNLIENNEIHDCGQIYWHSPAIFVWQSGANKIAHNLIYNMPYTGVVLSGPRPKYFNSRMGHRREITGAMNFSEISEKFEIDQKDWYQFHHYVDLWDKMFKYLFTGDNIVEYNELHHMDRKIDDGNAIYLSGTGNNNIVRRNYVHDNISSCLHGIIRADDQAKNATITENIISRFTGTGIKIKHPNIVTNNYIIDWVPSEQPDGKISPMGEFLNVSPAGPIKGSIIKNNICYQSCGLTQPFFGVSRYYPLGKLTKTSDIEADHNLFYTTGLDNNCLAQLNKNIEEGIEKNSLVADPLFEGFEDKGFKLKETSPAHGLGIQQIDFEKIGLQKIVSKVEY